MANRLIAAVMVPAALVHIATAGGRAGRVAGRWVRMVGWLTGVRFQVAGAPAGPPGVMKVVVANHSSPLDIPALLYAEPNITFVAAADLFRIPLLAAAMSALRAVPVDRRSGTGVQLELPAGWAASDGVLAVFPEGGISPTRRPFRRSAFALAIEHGAAVVPVAIHGSGEALPPRAKLGIRPAKVTVEFLEPIPTAGMTLADRYRLSQLAERRIGEALDGATARRAA